MLSRFDFYNWRQTIPSGYEAGTDFCQQLKLDFYRQNKSIFCNHKKSFLQSK